MTDLIALRKGNVSVSERLFIDSSFCESIDLCGYGNGYGVGQCGSMGAGSTCDSMGTAMFKVQRMVLLVRARSKDYIF